MGDGIRTGLPRLDNPTVVAYIHFKDDDKGLLIADLLGFNWWLGLGKVKVKKIKLSYRINRNHSKLIKVTRSRSKSIIKWKKCKSLIDFDHFDNHFDWFDQSLRLIRPITSIDFDWLRSIRQSNFSIDIPWYYNCDIKCHHDPEPWLTPGIPGKFQGFWG